MAPSYRCLFSVASSGFSSETAPFTAGLRFFFNGGAEFGGLFFPFDRLPVASITPRIQ